RDKLSLSGAGLSRASARWPRDPSPALPRVQSTRGPRHEQLSAPDSGLRAPRKADGRIPRFGALVYRCAVTAPAPPHSRGRIRANAPSLILVVNRSRRERVGDQSHVLTKSNFMYKTAKS